MRFHTVLLLSGLALLAFARPACAAASYSGCTGFVTQLPTSISTPGVWCLKQDLSTTATTGVGITIATNDVVLDCNDFMIKGAAGTTGTSIGITAKARMRDTVRHCNVQGFRYGLDFSDTSGGQHVVEDNQFLNNTSIGIEVQGNDSVIRRNRVFDTGGTTLTGAVSGITAYGQVTISGNSVSKVTGNGGYAYGIFTSEQTSSRVIDHNIVRGITSLNAFNYAIFNTGGGANIPPGPVTMTDNYLLGVPYQVTNKYNSGLYCERDKAGDITSSRAAQNMVVGFTNWDIGCQDAGQNDHSQ